MYYHHCASSVAIIAAKVGAKCYGCRRKGKNIQKTDVPVFSTEVPPDLEHAPQIREEAFDWLDTHFPGVLSFKTGEVLKMGGENGRRWLIARLRERGIGDEELFNTPAAADALTSERPCRKRAAGQTPTYAGSQPTAPSRWGSGPAP